jgi:general secretion pathway protein H
MSLRNLLAIPSKNAGFTLIELLIVLIIIGVVMTAVSLNIGAKPSSAKQAAGQLQSLLELARDDAILKGQILGWKISPETYAFYRYKDKKWLPLTADKLLRSYQLQPELNYKLVLDNSKVSYDKESLPQIIILPDGSLNDFSLFIQLQDRTENYQVYSQQGKIKTQRVDEKK